MLSKEQLRDIDRLAAKEKPAMGIDARLFVMRLATTIEIIIGILGLVLIFKLKRG